MIKRLDRMSARVADLPLRVILVVVVVVAVVVVVVIVVVVVARFDLDRCQTSSSRDMRKATDAAVTRVFIAVEGTAGIGRGDTCR
jgi:NADH:ubiquinone oxidoreductase subunit 6 (subunit J)